ncbi:MAG: hypothetical protein C0485_08090 [Pirellula sp.]|nr:hypothetical protein [Pirellula sp.]
MRAARSLIPSSATPPMGLPFIQLLADFDGEPVQATTIAVALTVIALFAAGAAKCASIMARPQTHTLCAGSLAMLLATFTLSAILNFLKTLYPLPSSVTMAFQLACMLGLTVAWTMAVLGLLDYRRRNDSYNQGRVQAWFALGISTIPVIIFAVGFSTGFMQSVRDAVERNASQRADKQEKSPAHKNEERSSSTDDSRTNDRSEIAATSDSAADVSVQPVALEVYARQTNAKTTQRFPDLNFEFTPPEAGWIKLHAASISPDAEVAYTSKAPQVIFFIIAEQVGADADVKLDALLEVVKSNLYASFDEVEFEQSVAQTISGVEGLSIKATYVQGAVQQRRAMWVGARGGYLYQLISSGRAKHSEQLDARHDEMLAGFRVIDGDAVVYSGGQTPITRYESEHYGYEVDFSGAPWLKASGERELLPAAEVATTLRNRAALAVVPLHLPHDNLALDDVSTALARTLLEDLDANARLNVKVKTAVADANADGVEETTFGYQQSSSAGASVEYRFRILRQGRRAVMAVGWTVTEETEGLAAVDQALASMKFAGEHQPNNDDGNEDQRFWRGMALNSLGLDEFEQQDQAASLACFEEAIKLQPTNQTPLMNYAHVLAETGKPEQALAELAKRIDQYEDNARLREKQAMLLLETGDDDQCVEVLEKLLADGHRSEEAMLVMVGVQMKNQRYEPALAAVDKFLQGGPSQQATQIKSSLLSKLGRHDESIALLQEIRQARPRDVANLLHLAMAYYEAKKFDEALALTQELLDMGKAAEEVYLVRGKCQLDQKLFNEARESFELALKANPRSQTAEEGIAVASAMLGQGNNTIVKTLIEPVPLPAEIAGRLTQIPANDQAAGTFGAYESYRVVGYDYRQGERWRSTTYRKIKIVGQEGIDRFTTLTVTFNPLSERVFVNRLTVYDAAGKVVAEGNANDYYVAADDKSELATGDNTLTIPVPQIQPGNTLEFTYTREQLNADDFGFENVILTSSIPVQAAAAFVAGDVAKLAHTSSGPEPRTSADGGLFWGVSEPPVYVDESSQPPIAEFLPVIHLTDAGQEWSKLGDEYAVKIADRLAPDAVTTAKATELTQGLATPEEKIAVLTRFVQKQLNYQGLEFGVRGLMPNLAAKSLENGYGDCKDHSLLLKQLLNAVGIPAQLTLVNSSGEVDGKLASSSQFDHMILSLPGPTGDDSRVFVDCTAKHADPRQVTTNDFAGNLALVVEPGASRLVPIPPRTGPGTEIRCGREVTIVCDEPERESADAVIREQVAFSGAPAGALRSVLVSMQPRDRKEAIARLISEHDEVDVTRLEVVNLEDPAAALILQLEYRMDNVFHRVGDSGTPLSGRLVSPWETWATVAYATTERLTPFRTTAASIVGSTRYVLPAGFILDRGLESVESPPSNTFVTWRVEANATENSTLLHVDRRAGSHPATAYGSCSAEAKQLLDRVRRPIALREIPATAKAEEKNTLR